MITSLPVTRLMANWVNNTSGLSVLPEAFVGGTAVLGPGPSGAEKTGTALWFLSKPGFPESKGLEARRLFWDGARAHLDAFTGGNGIPVPFPDKERDLEHAHATLRRFLCAVSAPSLFGAMNIFLDARCDITLVQARIGVTSPLNEPNPLEVLLFRVLYDEPSR